MNKIDLIRTLNIINININTVALSHLHYETYE